LQQFGGLLGARWLSGLREMVMPAKAVCLAEATIAKRPARHRRRFDAVHMLAALHQPPVTMRARTVGATAARTAALIASVRLVNRQIGGTHGRLNGSAARLTALVLPAGRIVLTTPPAGTCAVPHRRGNLASRTFHGVAPVTGR
jgi:hypothetical protein